MFKLPKLTKDRAKFDRRILRKNDISLLLLDERWNVLFKSTEKSPDILRCEEKIKEYLKEQARLTQEAKESSLRKKACMDRIIQLTPEAFDRDSEQAKQEMHLCEQEIKRINERAKKIEEDLEHIPDLIKEANLELLEHTVNQVYFTIRSNQKRVEELDRLILETREKLKEYIDERGQLSEGDTETYSYFHDLIGGEELERLDREFFK